MATSLYNIAQQVQIKTGKGLWQEVISDVRKSYAFVIKSTWFENKKMDVGELDGSVIIPFPNEQPILDKVSNYYYIDLKSTYVQLPQEGGLVSVSYMSEPNVNFVLTNAGSVGRLNRIKAGVMGGRQLYYVENSKMWFPRMNVATNLPVLIRMGCAIDDYDVDAPINISPNVEEQIVALCIQKYLPQTPALNEQIK